MKATLTSIAGLCLTTSMAVAQTPTLTIYTYDSFVAEWGPGPAIKAGFEELCGCDLQFLAAGDGAALLSRLRLEGARTSADIVLGLDTNLIPAARETGLFGPHDVQAEFDLPLAWEDTEFLPFDWSYFAFVGNQGDPAPSSFRELAESDLRVTIQDPRSSTPGLGLLLWVQMAYGEEAPAIWEALSDNILTVTPGWTEAYNLFLEGEADAALSYTTSPAFHAIDEGDPTKIAWPFEEGHYMQIEVAGIIKDTDQPELARQFMEYLVSDAAQSVLAVTNWMYPAVMPEEGLPEAFGELIVPETALLYPPQEAVQIRETAIEDWRAALSR